MLKKLVVLLSVFVVWFSLVSIPSIGASDKDSVKITIKENISTDGDVLEILNIDNFKKGNSSVFKNQLNNKEKLDGFINLNLTMVPNEEQNLAKISGSGVAKILNSTYPLKYEGDVDIVRLNNGDNVLSGTLDLVFNNGEYDEKSYIYRSMPNSRL
ncbi:hypothetical protein ACERII_10975 [Evansella sp. AB-rgal1]|uniref:hypothetical protein n=1 Tax=Evansella sp. AB-rgal1 TaxID=3242696 RepID=UPI00359D57EB